MSDNRPIGILDSGIGGMTIAKGITELLPNEQIIFFGDTTHLPYGDKSKDSLKTYVHRITTLLLEKNCKAVLIACNSASAAAYISINKDFGKDLHILNVIDPVVEYVSKTGGFQKIGVIGTKATINSKAFLRKFKRTAPELEVKTMATPLLAPMIEEGFFNNKISQTIINAYLDSHYLKDIDALVLACTHYPLIKKEIEKYYIKNNREVMILDSMQIMADYTQNILAKANLLSPVRDENANHHFYVSDYTQSFQNTTHLFFGQNVKLQHLPIWD